jgi:hypothetical protein
VPDAGGGVHRAKHMTFIRVITVNQKRDGSGLDQPAARIADPCRHPETASPTRAREPAHGPSHQLPHGC